MPFIASKTLIDLQAQIIALNAELEKLKNRPFVTNIETKGRSLILTVNKAGINYTIETYSLLSTDLEFLKELLK